MSRSTTPSAIVALPKLRLMLLAALTALTTVLGSCGPTATPQSQSDTSSTAAAPNTKILKIVTTTIPLTNFTKAVVGDRAEVTYLLPTNTDPHDFQARPDDVRTISEAAVLVQNGLQLESYLDNLITNANNPNLKIIDTSTGIQPFTRQEEHTEEEHSTESSAVGKVRAGEEHAGEEYTEDEASAAGTATAEAQTEAVQAAAHEHGELDPHVWLDPKRAIQQVENIRDGLITADPDGEAIYIANAAAYIEQLQALDAEIAETLKPYAGEEFITYHDFAFYFAESYGLQAEYFVGLPEENPAPADVKRVLETAQAENLKVLLTEPQAGEGQFAALAKDLDVQVSSFDPLETSDPQGLERDYYLKVMRQNVENLKAAFGQAQ